jgi:hypothetical protein
MDRIDRDLDFKWHVALNTYNIVGGDFKEWMYEAKRMAEEVSRMVIWFGLERRGEMPKVHQQCSQQSPVPLVDNHLSCCLGKKCRECPHLLALEKAEVTPEQLDEIKAWTCAGHILQEVGARPNTIDTSEGYIMTEGDKMFWQNVYQNMAGMDEGE